MVEPPAAAAHIIAATVPQPVSTSIDPVAAAAAVFIIVVVAWGLTLALLRAARYPHPTSMITALALLTLLSLLGLGMTDGEPANTFGTLAATGMGALAGAVTSQFNQHNQTKGKDDDQPDRMG